MRSAFFILSALALSANAFSPVIMATRAIKKSAPKATTGTKVVAKKPVVNNPFASNPFAKKEVVAKKVVAKKVVAKKVVAKKVVAKKVVSKPAAMNSFKMPTVKSPVRSGSKKAPPASKGRPSFDTSSIKFNVGSGSGIFPTAKGIARPDFSDPKLQIKRDPAFYKAAAAQRMAKINSPSDFTYESGLTELEIKQRKTIPEFLTGQAKSRADAKDNIVGEIESPKFGGLSQDRFQLLFIAVFGLLTLVGSLSGSY